MFSTTEKPAPTAKPMITASSFKPIRLIAEQPDDDDGLQRLLDPGRGEPAVVAEPDRKRVEEIRR